ncbi:MAG: histidine--tRNA ligase [Rhodospirillales bacterium]|nr:histidine--tRNA ligase [Alphaproteobacteria bacterium]MBL6948817.1 histidine--tRNA ligase [Rhodospirillales bacterium]
MSNLQPPRGTADILPQDQRRHRHVTDTAQAIAGRYGFEEMSTPIFEATEVFKRTLGETSDIVTKEMYVFDDKKGRSITLRPEGTAGVARAFITHLRSEPLPLKFFYRGPMFRYERMQKGRQRQFHQFGVELLGVPQPLGDVEAIAMGAHILEALGVADKVTLQINTLGDAECREAYREKLVTYLEGFRSDLSEDSLERLGRNPLRIFDSKDESDRAVVKNAPRLIDHLNQASTDFFDAVKGGLDAAGVAYEINPGLVRGLDYYGHTAFEFVTKTLGAQGTVLAGGRYDGLIQLMGGPPTPGIGWAAGVERLALMTAEAPPAPRPVTIIPRDPAAQTQALVLAQQLRRGGLAVDLGYSGNLKKRLDRANKAGATAAVILDGDSATVRDMETGEQTDVALAGLEDHLQRYR